VIAEGEAVCRGSLCRKAGRGKASLEGATEQEWGTAVAKTGERGPLPPYDFRKDLILMRSKGCWCAKDLILKGMDGKVRADDPERSGRVPIPPVFCRRVRWLLNTKRLQKCTFPESAEEVEKESFILALLASDCGKREDRRV
jgi:hypothetical protein